MESPTPAARRRHCFMEEDDGLASIVPDLESGVPNNAMMVSRPLCLQTNKCSLIQLSSPSISPRFVVVEEVHQPHFLDSCFLCRKPLANRDIFMYRGNVPFCSDECRQKEVDLDEEKEKSLNRKALRNKDQRKASSSSPQGYTLGTTVAAA